MNETTSNSQTVVLNSQPVKPPNIEATLYDLDAGNKPQELFFKALEVANTAVPFEFLAVNGIALAGFFRNKGNKLKRVFESFKDQEKSYVKRSRSWWRRYILSDLEDALKSVKNGSTDVKERIIDACIAGAAGCFSISSKLEIESEFKSLRFERNTNIAVADFCAHLIGGLWAADVGMMGENGILPTFWEQLLKQDIRHQEEVEEKSTKTQYTKKINSEEDNPKDYERFLEKGYDFKDRFRMKSSRWLEIVSGFGGGRITIGGTGVNKERAVDFQSYLDVNSGEEKVRSEEDMRSVRILYCFRDSTGAWQQAYTIATFPDSNKVANISSLALIGVDLSGLITNLTNKAPLGTAIADGRNPVFEFALFEATENEAKQMDAQRLDYSGVARRAPVARLVSNYIKANDNSGYVDGIELVQPHYAGNADTIQYIYRKMIASIKRLKSNTGQQLYEGLAFKVPNEHRTKVIRRSLETVNNSKELKAVEISTGYDISEPEKNLIKFVKDQAQLGISQIAALAASCLTHLSTYICVDATASNSNLSIAYGPASKDSSIVTLVDFYLKQYKDHINASQPQQSALQLFSTLQLVCNTEQPAKELLDFLNPYREFTNSDIESAQKGRSFLQVLDTHSPGVMKKLFKFTFEKAHSFIAGGTAQISSIRYGSDKLGGDFAFTSAGASTVTMPIAIRTSGITTEDAEGKKKFISQEKSIEIRRRFDESDIAEILKGYDYLNTTDIEEIEAITKNITNSMTHYEFRLAMILVATISTLLLGKKDDLQEETDRLVQLQNQFVLAMQELHSQWHERKKVGR